MSTLSHDIESDGSSDFDVPDPEGDDQKEVFAFFGLAAYMGQVLEGGLFNLATVLRARHDGVESLAAFDSIFDELRRHTFGRLLRYAEAHGDLRSELLEALNEALKRRNYLTHEFFWDRAADFFVSAGRKAMIDELRDSTIHFKRTSSALQAAVRDAVASVGLTDGLLQQERERLLKESRDRYGTAGPDEA